MNELAVAQGLTWPLLSSFVFFWGVGVLALRSNLGLSTAVIVATLKSLLVLSYFTIWSDGSWFIGGDDNSYFNTGLLLLESGNNPLEVWFSPVGRYHLVEHPIIAGYHWWNMLWMYFFGPEYGVVVMANMATTFLAGIFVYKIAQELGCKGSYAAALCVFFLLHWDVLAWSSFLNIKEPLVAALMSINIWAFLKLEKGQWWAVGPYLLALAALLWIRFYLPALLISAAAAYLFIFSQRRLLLLPVISLGLGVVLWKYWVTLSLVERLVVFDLQVFVRHFAKAVWSPLPWNVTDPALYLVVSSALNLISRPLGILAIFLVFYLNQVRSVAFIGLVLLAGYVFYSLVPPIASARHLAPFNWLLIGFEFHIGWVLVDQFRRRSGVKNISTQSHLL